MRLHILAIGRDKAAEDALVDEYRRRIRWPLHLTLLPASQPDLEAQKLLAATPVGAYKILLDETGKSFTSRQFAASLQALRERALGDVVFFIGGADGAGAALRAAADNSWCFGTLTWPHRLVRVMLLEQLYRAQQILAGHPYHRD